jgi:hypothetical protein
VRGEVRPHAILFGESMVNIVLDTGGGAAPGAAPTPQKRGPWRLLWMSRQGRLPTSKAPPRRGFRRYLVNYMHELYAVLISSRVSVAVRLATSVVAESLVPQSAGRAMVAGMAMASAAAMLPNWGHEVCRPAIKHLQGFSGVVCVVWAAPADKGLVTGSFTPRHTAVPEEAKITYDMVVWGSAPRGTKVNMLPPVVTGLEQIEMGEGSPALTPRRPPWPARACILGRAGGKRGQRAQAST